MKIEGFDKRQLMAISAAVIVFACQDDNLRDLSANERAVALDGRHKAMQILLRLDAQPTELKSLGLDLLAVAMGRGRGR